MVRKNFGVLITMMAVVLCFFIVPGAQAASSLFFGGFESNSFSEWDSPVGSNFALSGGTCRMGPDSNVVAVKITGDQTPHGQILKKVVSTVGYENISVSFCFKWDVIEGSDAAIIEYTTDGITWQVVKTIDNSTVDHMMYAADNTELATSNGVGEIPTPFPVTLEELASHGIALPADAANQANFAIRIREQMTDDNDFIWIDDFQVSGTPLTVPPPSSNLISNPSVETASSDPSMPLNWFKGGWGNNTRVFTYPVAGNEGLRGAKVEITSYNNGDAKWYFQEVPVTSGQTYHFSDWYVSNIPNYVAIQYRMTNGTFTYATIAQEAASPSSWQDVDTTFVVPANVTSLTVFHLIKQVGYLITDNYSLTVINDPSNFDTGKISLTFDDNLGSIYTNGIPILDAAGFKSTQYTVSGLLDTPTRMTTANVLAMQANGHDIGGHTITHPNLINLSPTQLQTEIGGGRRDLALLGATPLDNFAYPEGGYNDAIKNVVRSSGFSGARTVDLGFNTKNTDRYALKVQQVNAVTTFDQVKTAIDSAIADKTWLILLFHAIDHSGATYGTTPEILQQIVDYLQQVGAPVITVSQGLSLMNPGTPLVPDTTIPVITLNGSSSVDINNGSPYTDSGATAFDNVDGSLTPDIIVSGDTVNTSVNGVYHIHYNVSDLAGNAATEVIRTVTVDGLPVLVNLVQNPSLETAAADPSMPFNWFKGGWGNNTRILTYPVAGVDGASAAKVEITSHTSGDAKWYFKEVSVTPGETYTFSDSYISTLPSYLATQFKMTNGTFTYLDIANVPAGPAGVWQTVQSSFVVPASVTHLTMFHVINQVGTLTVDNYSLTSQTPPPPTTNLIANPSVETTSANPALPQSWKTGKWGTNTTTFTYPTAGIDGAKSVKIDMTSHSSGDAKWYFNDVPASPSTLYTFSDSYIATILSEPTVRFLLSNGSHLYETLATLPAVATATPFNVSFTTPANVVSMTVFHTIFSIGSLTTDNFSITQ